MPHFEIHVGDVEAAKQFYGGLFGRAFEPMPEAEDMHYHLIEGRDIGAAHGVTGGIFQRMDKAHPPGTAVRGWTMTFDVDDCDERYAWALKNGGSEALPPTDMPGIGRFAYVEDGQGNIVGMLTSEGDA